MTSVKVFISYSHDSEKHRDAVLELAQRLRSNNIDAWIDRFELAPRQGWMRWMRDRIEEADFVILVCTERYMKRFYGREEAGVGSGATWEGLVLSTELYEAHGKTTRFVPVVMEVSGQKWIPDVLRSHTYHQYPEGHDGLYRVLTDQPEILPAKLGEQRTEVSAVAARWIDTPGDLQEIEVGAWFDGTIYHCAILMTRARSGELWSMEVMESLPLHQGLGEVPKGMALVNLVKNGQHVGALMALTRLQVLFLAESASTVKAGQTVAVVRGPIGKQLVEWNPIKNTFGPYLQHSPPLGYRVWTGWRGTPEHCIRIDRAELIELGRPTRLAVRLKPMVVPPGLIEVRSPVSGTVELPQPSPEMLSTNLYLCTVSGENLKIDLSCDFVGRLWELRVRPGQEIEAGQVILVAGSGLVEVRSHIVGSFYRCPNPDAPPFVEVGDEVRPGQVVCIVEALKLMNEVEVQVAGRVVEILVGNAQPVEYDEVMMKIDCS